MTFSSVYTLQAIQAVEELDKASANPSHFMQVSQSENPKQVARMIRMLSKDRDWHGRLVVATEGAMVFSKLKEITRAERLEKLLERVLLSVEDEALYDEIMEALYGTRAE